MSRPILILCALLASACTVSRELPPRQDEPGEAAEYYASKRRGSDDIERSYELARQHMTHMARYSTASDAYAPRGPRAQADGPQPFDRWQFLGPGNIGGRTRTLVFDPQTPAIMYAGGVSGGIWKTVDGGGRWEPVGDALANIAVNSMAIHPLDGRILYAGTGEGYFREEQRGTGLPLRGNGIFITRDGAATWSRLASTNNEDFHWVNDLAISTHDPSRIYAATRTGVWRSRDSGESWTRVVTTTVKGGCLDLAFRGDTAGDYLFASCGTFEQATVYRAKQAESDGPWESVLSEPNMGRTTLAIAPSNPAIIYALSASNESGNYDQGLLAVFRSDSSGDSGTWQAKLRNTSSDYGATLLLTNPIAAARSLCNPLNGQNSYVTMGWYCNAIAVDPVDPNRVWAGGVDLFRSDDGGTTWGVASYWWRTPVAGTSFVHADQHAIVFHPRYDGSSNRTLYVANDGGVARTDDALADPARGRTALCGANDSKLAFTGLSRNYGATQFYHGAVFPDGRTFIAGAQDNGTVRGTIEAGSDAWDHVFGGDGGYVAVDPSDPSIVYAESQNGNIVKSLNGGRQFIGASNGLFDLFLFVTPFTLDPNLSSRLWIGGARMWRSNDATTTWQLASTAVPGRVSAIAVAPGNSERVLAGTNIGHIVRNDFATSAISTTAWTPVKPRDGFVSSLAFDPTDASIVYATYSGFGGAHFWKSADGGTTWTSSDGTGDGALPDIPAHAIAVDPTRPSRLFLGTDLGMFVSTDGGASWAVENTGYAAVVTEAVTIGQGTRGPAVYAFTHGRGAWRAELVQTAPKRRSVKK